MKKRVMEPADKQPYLRALPAVDELLRHPQMQSHLKTFSKEFVVGSIRRIMDRKRQVILNSADPQEAASITVAPEGLLADIEEEIAQTARPSLRRVINATGVVLHTNLGRLRWLRMSYGISRKLPVGTQTWNST